MRDAGAVLADLWSLAGCDPAALESTRLAGREPALPTRFAVGTAATATIAAAGLAAAELWRARTGRRQTVGVEMRAAVAAFRSERYLRVDGETPPDPWSPISGFYRTRDQRWIQLHCNFPHHLQGALLVLGCDATREAVGGAIANWNAVELDDALAARGMCAALVRSPEEWRAHPQSRAVAALPLFEIERFGDSPPEPCGAGSRPLSGVRALDLTRVIAGPVCGRTLAEHGAEVLLITAQHLPSIDTLVIDTGAGKRSARLDLRRGEDTERMRDLLREADVFVQSYRPGALAGRGFSPDEAARLRPGIVCVTLSAYGHQGPWRERRGFDTLVQSASGIAFEHGRSQVPGPRCQAGEEPSVRLEKPKHLPAAALDYATGYLAAFGAMVALRRRASEGGSYLVRVSLAQTARWLDELGRVDGIGCPEPRRADVADLLQASASPFGSLSHVAPTAQLSETPGLWARAAVPLGADAAEWEPSQF